MSGHAWPTAALTTSRARAHRFCGCRPRRRVGEAVCLRLGVAVDAFGGCVHKSRSLPFRLPSSSFVSNHRRSLRIDRRCFGAGLGALFSPWGLALEPPSVARAQTEPPAADAPPAPLRFERKSSRSEQGLAVKGIYVQQFVAEDPARLGELIEKA